MILSDLLTELRENILHDRTDQVSAYTSRLWSDATLVRYIDEAQRRFARRSFVLQEAGNTSRNRITLVGGQDEYPLHASLLAVVSAKVTGNRTDLTRTGHATLDGYRLPVSDYFDINTVAQFEAGAPVAYSTEEYLASDTDGRVARIVLRVYPVPTSAEAGDTIDMRVIRLPVDALTTANLKAEPEIPEDHHIEMLDWAAYLALRIADIDAGMPQRAEEFARSFEVHVQEAKKQMMRKLFAPMGWGFGRGGFVWEQGHG